MHIAVVCQVFYPDPQSTSQLFSGLLAAAANPQLKFTVVTGFTSDQPLARRETMPGNPHVEIRRVGVAVQYKKCLVKRALHYLGFSVGATWELWKLRRCDLVFGLTNPPYTPVWLWLLHRLFLPRYQIMLQDVFPEGLVALGKLNDSAWITRLWRSLNRKAYQAADTVFSLGRDMSELMARVYQVPRERLVYMPHWSVVEVPQPRAVHESRLLKSLGLQDKFVVQYSGNMGIWHDLTPIIRAAEMLRGQSRIHFLMIGDGMRRSGAQALAQELKLDNLTWLPFRPAEELEDSLAACHLALISQRAGLEGVAVPCKLYGILASGRGILALAPAKSEVGLVVQEENCGRVLAPDDARGLADAILELAGNPECVERLGLNAHQAYAAKYTLETSRRRFLTHWRSAAESGSSQPPP